MSRCRSGAAASLLVAGLLALAALIAAPRAAEAALDRSFGGNGFVTGVEGLGGHAARYGHTRLLVAGAGAGEFVAVRYLSSGAPDPSFGTAGVARVAWTAPFQNAQFDTAKLGAVAVQPDGKILLGGSYEPNSLTYHGENWRAVMARLNPDGSLDQSFRSPQAPPGKVQLRRPTWREFRAIALQGEKIVVAGETGFVARLNADGSLDHSFAYGHGSLNLPPYPKELRHFPRLAGITGLLVPRSGRIFAVGYANGRVLLSRLHPNGRFDPSFGGNGSVRLDASAKSGCRCSLGEAIARDNHGRLVVPTLLLGRHPTAEFSIDDLSGTLALVRFRRFGRPDRSFGHRGVSRHTKVGNRALSGGHGVAIQPDGRIVVAGRLFSQFALARFRPDGHRDRSFFGNGVLSASFGAGFAEAVDPLIDGSGRIVAGGYGLYGAGAGLPLLLATRLQ